MTFLRGLTACVLLAGAAAFAVLGDSNTVFAALGGALLLYGLVQRPLRRALLRAAPAAASALTYYAFQVIGGSTAVLLPLKMLVVFLCASAAVGIFPSAEILANVRPHSRVFHVFLYVFFVSHFLHILGAETLRVLRAWKWSSRGTRGRTRIRTLGGAMSGLLLRTLTRAERFYAAQLVRGLAE